MMLTGIRQMAMKEIPEPLIVKPGDVKIKMAAVGICGSDIHYYTQGQIGSQVVQFDEDGQESLSDSELKQLFP